jgi:hypothetical protein
MIITDENNAQEEDDRAEAAYARRRRKEKESLAELDKGNWQRKVAEFVWDVAGK